MSTDYIDVAQPVNPKAGSAEVNDGDPAFPVVAENGLGHIADGLTKREHFAGEFVKAQLIKEGIKMSSDARHTARLGIMYADALIAELGKDET